jgi:hypothetical protein
MERTAGSAKSFSTTPGLLCDAQNGYPASRDGVDRGNPITMGSGQSEITNITFSARTAHFIGIMRTGTDNDCNGSIYELVVYRKNRFNLSLLAASSRAAIKEAG